MAVPNTGSWTTYANVQTTLDRRAVRHQNLYLTFTGTGTGLFDVDDFTLVEGQRRTRHRPGRGPGRQVPGRRGGGTADGTQIQLYTCNGSAAQTWTRNGQTLRALGKCLDVSGGGTADGTKIQLWTCNGTGAQNWTAGRRRHAAQPAARASAWTCRATTPPTAPRSTSGPATAAANQRWTTP